MTTTPAMPEGVTLEDLMIPLRAALDTCHDTDWTLSQFKTHITHALAALATLQAQPAVELSDADIAHAVRSLYADDEAAKMGLPDDIKTVRAVLALRPQSESEPFGYFRSHLWGWTDCGPDDEGAKALYERPQPVPMTDEQVDRIWNALPMGNGFWLSFARAVEAHHGITAPAGGEADRG